MRFKPYTQIIYRTILFSSFFISAPIFADKNNLSVMSWNIYFDDSTGDMRYPEIIDTIHKQSTDIVCLQEVTNKFISHLSKNKQLKNYAFINTKGKKPYRNIILSKKEVLQTGTITLPTNMNRSAPYIKIRSNTKIIKVINLHLDSMSNDTALRIRQLEEILNHSKDDKNVLLCGDFNFGDNDKENSLIKSFFKDAGEKNKSNTYDIEGNSLANNTKFILEKSRRLDRILTKGKIRPEEYQILISPFSDHYPIISKIETIK